MSRRLVNKFGDIENIENSEYFVQVMRDISPKWDYWDGRKYLMINYIWSNIKFSLDLNWFNPVLTDLNFRSCLLSVLSDISLSIEIVRLLLDLEKYFTMNCNLWFINQLTFPNIRSCGDAWGGLGGVIVRDKMLSHHPPLLTSSETCKIL